MTPVKPKPKATAVVCSVCGLPWGGHGSEPTLLTCVELLRAELAKRPTHPTFSSRPFVFPLSSGNLS